MEEEKDKAEAADVRNGRSAVNKSITFLERILFPSKGERRATRTTTSLDSTQVAKFNLRLITTALIKLTCRS